MAEGRLALEVEERAERGSAAARRMRRAGLVPGVIYGGGADPVAITIAERELRRALTGDHGLNAILDVAVAGSSRPAILKEFQRDPISGRVTHVDFVVVRLDRPIQTTVGIELVGAGDSPGVREGGALQQVAREITIEALPLEVPERIEVDVSMLEIGDSIRLEDTPEVAGVRFVDDPHETVIATVTAPTRVEEPEEELEEGEEGAEVPEGAEGAAEAPAADEGDAGGEPGTDEG
jgi:large subunit ribosomal protein L25